MDPYIPYPLPYKRHRMSLRDQASSTRELRDLTFSNFVYSLVPLHNLCGRAGRFRVLVISYSGENLLTSTRGVTPIAAGFPRCRVWITATLSCGWALCPDLEYLALLTLGAG